jgi:hypothetical protein
MRSNVVGVGILVLLFGASIAIAAGTPAKCAVAKQKAIGKKISARLKCYSTAVQKTLPVDAECLTKANTKFSDAFAKAEAAGGCLTGGDAAVQELAADVAVARIAGSEASTPVPPTFGVPCGTTCGGPGVSAFLCAGNIAVPRPLCVANPLTPSSCTGSLDCEVTLGAGFICVTTIPGCNGSRFCAMACP